MWLNFWQTSPTVGVYTSGMHSSVCSTSILKYRFSSVAWRLSSTRNLSSGRSNRSIISLTRATCSSPVDTAAGSSPSRPLATRSSFVKARPRFRCGQPSFLTPSVVLHSVIRSFCSQKKGESDGLTGRRSGKPGRSVPSGLLRMRTLASTISHCNRAIGPAPSSGRPYCSGKIRINARPVSCRDVAWQ